ncbi:MAG: methylated-DNA--[protein]-cysteine S-methyltransferase [Betaproteobacteria bacterium]
MTTYTGCYVSPIGPLVVQVTESGLVRVEFVDERPVPSGVHPLLERCLSQLDEYFRGLRQEFSVPVAQPGTEFQQKVWAALAALPYGQTTTYQALAAGLGDARAARAVGAAAAGNRLAIIVPCHRVIGKDGRPRRYAWGTWRKEWLLRHEQRSLIARRRPKP